MDLAESRERYRAYIDEHRANVKRAFEIVRENCSHLRFGRYGILELAEENINNHDESKYCPTEFEAYRQYYYPADGETPDEEAMNYSWELHKERNPHHWENWTTNDELRLDERDAYFIEMVCDWLAMSMKFGGDTRTWYETQKEGVELPGSYERYLCTIIDLVDEDMRSEGLYGRNRREENV